jgi:hypothetical protein
MADSILSGVNRTLTNAIPLVLRKNQMDWERAQFEEQEKRDEQERQEQLKQKQLKWKSKIAADAIKIGGPEGQAILRSIGPGLEVGGYMLEMKIGIN